MTKYTVTVDGDVFEIEVGVGGRVWVNQQPYEVDLRHVGGNGRAPSRGEYSLLVDNRSYEIDVADSDQGQQWVMVGGRPYRTRLKRGQRDLCRSVEHDDGPWSAAGGGCATREATVCPTEVRAPLPGLLVELCVSQDELVQEQQVVAIVESMKMNLEIRAPRDGVVRDLCAVPGRQVAQNEVLALLGTNGYSSDD